MSTIYTIQNNNNNNSTSPRTNCIIFLWTHHQAHQGTSESNASTNAASHQADPCSI